MPIAKTYKPDPQFAALGAEFADPVAPARFPKERLRYRNQRAAAAIGLDALTEEEFQAVFARFETLPGQPEQPLAMRYHGHQFRAYNPDIGDGRGFLFAQLRDDRGRLMDLGTKGSGQTPYSRFGDGRLTLKGGMREVLGALMCEALGVSTSLPFALFETGEHVDRPEEPGGPHPGGVFTRLQHSHIRIGTFQRHAFFGRADLIEQLIEHCIAHYFPDLAAEPNLEAKACRLIGEIGAANARMCAQWMAAGFTHGVLNTDNINITGESFDYGPWKFIPASLPAYTAASFDHYGLYAFGRQPESISWALAQLGGALTLAASDDALIEALGAFPNVYRQAIRQAVFARLGLQPSADADRDLAFISAWFEWLTQSQAPYEQCYFDWFCGAASAERALAGPNAEFYRQPAFAPIQKALMAFDPERPDRIADPYFGKDRPLSMLKEDVEAIWAPIEAAGDWSRFDAALDAIEAARLAYALAANRPA